jgi:hypothetical protein
MNTVAIWLLVAVGAQNYGGSPTQVVERFVSPADCEAVRSQILVSYQSTPKLVCVSAKVVKP